MLRGKQGEALHYRTSSCASALRTISSATLGETVIRTNLLREGKVMNPGKPIFAFSGMHCPESYVEQITKG